MSLSRRAAPIVAVATAPGRGAVGIVRLSGSKLAAIAEALCGRCPAPRVATFTVLRDAAGQPIDEGLALYFPAPQSYTGEDVLELQGHGGPVVLQLLLARCLEVGAAAGLRLAEPGEFTERAFLNDKIDLAQAEAVADLIDAGTEAAARSASRSLAGALSERVDALHARIVRLRTLVEATLDFPDEEIDFLQSSGARAQLDAIDAALDELLDGARQGALLREGMRVVLAGQPNVGKSSLLNALAGAELAIVTPIPGTTRDRVGQTIQIEGVPVHVVDTAGLREHTADEVERIGIGRSWEAIADADCVLFLHDPTRRGQADYEAAEAAIAARLPEGTKCLHVRTKSDLLPASEREASRLTSSPGGDGRIPENESRAGSGPPGLSLSVSAHTGEGLAELRRALLEQVGWQASAQGLFSARARHVHALRRTHEHLAAARRHLGAGDTALELLAEELRLAHDALGEITGAFSADELLGEIFARFCIGK